MAWIGLSTRLRSFRCFLSLRRLLGGWSRGWRCWCGRSGGSTLAKHIIFELSNIVCFFSDDDNRRSERDELIRSNCLGDEPFFLNLKCHGSLIGFNLGNSVSSLYFISSFLQPLKNLAFFHGGRKSRHLTKRKYTDKTSCLGKAKRKPSPKERLRTFSMEDVNLNIYG